MIATSSASTTHASEWQRLTEAFNDILGDPSEQTVREAVKLLPALRRDMRAGATADLEKLIQKKVIVLARALINNEKPSGILFQHNRFKRPLALCRC